MLERERKYRLDREQLERLRVRAREIARPLRSEVQDTVLYDHPALDLLARRFVLRVRARDGRYELTFKPPRVMRGLDSVRQEFTVPVGSSAIEEILAGLGFTISVGYRKRTEIFSVERALFFIDDVEGLGWFCEVEASDEETDLGAIARALGLDEASLEPRTYPELVAAAAG